MELKLLPENHPILKEVAEPWDFEKDGSPEELVKAMTKLMFLTGGIGLAAPQVGILKRVFIMGDEDFLIACINPAVLESEEEIMGKEGCLSFPDLWLNVKRSKKIVAKYQDITGEQVNKEFEGLIARVYLHERDHLDGITFDTKVAKVALEMAKIKRSKRNKRR